jgi:Fe-S oxidoreductase
MAMSLLEKKMEFVNATAADRIVTANPGCMLQLPRRRRTLGNSSTRLARRRNPRRSLSLGPETRLIS